MRTRARSRNQTLRETSVSRASASAKARSAAGMSPARNSAYPRLWCALNSWRVNPSSAASRALADRSARAARRSRRRRWTAPRFNSTVGRSSRSRSASSATAASNCDSASSRRPLRSAINPLSSWTRASRSRRLLAATAAAAAAAACSPRSRPCTSNCENARVMSRRARACSHSGLAPGCCSSRASPRSTSREPRAGCPEAFAILASRRSCSTRISRSSRGGVAPPAVGNSGQDERTSLLASTAPLTARWQA